MISLLLNTRKYKFIETEIILEIVRGKERIEW